VEETLAVFRGLNFPRKEQVTSSILVGGSTEALKYRASEVWNPETQGENHYL